MCLLRDGRYERAERSGWLPGLDVDHLCTFLDRTLISEAKREYRAALQRR